mgnify:CR=1 FL=1
MSSHNASGNPNAPSNGGGGRPRGRARYSVAGDDAALDPPALDEPDDDQRQQYQQHARDGNRGVAQARVAAALADEEDEGMVSDEAIVPPTIGVASLYRLIYLSHPKTVCVLVVELHGELADDEEVEGLS